MAGDVRCDESFGDGGEDVVVGPLDVESPRFTRVERGPGGMAALVYRELVVVLGSCQGRVSALAGHEVLRIGLC